MWTAFGLRRLSCGVGGRHKHNFIGQTGNAAAHALVLACSWVMHQVHDPLRQEADSTSVVFPEGAQMAAKPTGFGYPTNRFIILKSLHFVVQLRHEIDGES